MTPYQRHRRKWEHCKRCDLCRQRKHIVLARGVVPADVMFIGEAPGASEDVLGKPFCGPAGHLLSSVIDRAIDCKFQCCLTNLVACFPREAKEAGTNEPPQESIEACRPRLEELMGLCRPKLVVCVGSLAAKNVPLLEGIPRVIDIIHPAAILRMDVSQQGLAVQRTIVVIEDAIEDL